MNQVFELGFTFFKIIVLAFVLSVMIFSDKLGKSLINVYFTFGVATLLGNTFYTFVHMLLSTGSPFFSAAEISSISVMLLFGASAHDAFRHRKRENSKALITGCIIYSLCNIVVWTLGNGTPVKNIFAAVSLGYMNCESLLDLKYAGAFDRREWTFFIVGSAGVLITKALGIVIGNSMVLEIIMYSLICLLIAYFMFRLLKDRKNKTSILFSLTAAGGSWSFVSRYFCSGLMNMVTDLAGIIMIFIMSIILYQEKDNDLF